MLVSAHALALTLAFTASASHVSLNFQVSRGNSFDVATPGASLQGLVLRRADGSETLVIQNKRTYYLAEFQLGLNNQLIGALIDTGLSDLWVGTKQNVLCSKSPNAGPGALQDFCTTTGVFDPSASTLWKVNLSADPFAIAYGDTTAAFGVWGTDSISFGDMKIDEFLFAAANKLNSTQNVLGIGLARGEATYNMASNKANMYVYDNLPIRMVREGIIKRNVYLLYLNSAAADLGTVLFGAVDYAKIDGPLYTMPIILTGEELYTFRLAIELSLVVFRLLEYLLQLYAITFDLGSTVLSMPSEMIQALTSGWSVDPELGSPYTLCSGLEADLNNLMTFAFGGFLVSIPLRNLVMKYGKKGDSDVCTLLMEDAGSGPVILGDDIMRYLYIVYDLGNLEILVGVAKYTTDTNIVPVLGSLVSSAVPVSTMRLVQPLTVTNIATSTKSADTTSKGAAATVRWSYQAAAMLVGGVLALV